MHTVRGWDSAVKRTGCPFRGPRWLGSLLLPASSQQSLTPVPGNRSAILASMSTVCMRYTHAHKTAMHIKQKSQNGGITRVTTKEQNEEELGQLISWSLKIRVTVACMGVDVSWTVGSLVTGSSLQGNTFPSLGGRDLSLLTTSSFPSCGLYTQYLWRILRS